MCVYITRRNHTYGVLKLFEGLGVAPNFNTLRKTLNRALVSQQSIDLSSGTLLDAFNSTSIFFSARPYNAHASVVAIMRVTLTMEDPSRPLKHICANTNLSGMPHRIDT